MFGRVGGEVASVNVPHRDGMSAISPCELLSMADPATVVSQQQLPKTGSSRHLLSLVAVNTQDYRRVHHLGWA